MAGPWGLISFLKNGNPFLPQTPAYECHGADEREQKATPFLMMQGFAGGSELMEGWRHEGGMCSRVT